MLVSWVGSSMSAGSTYLSLRVGPPVCWVSGVGSSMSAGSTHLSLRVEPPVCWFQGWGPPCLLAQPTVFKSGTFCMLGFWGGVLHVCWLNLPVFKSGTSCMLVSGLGSSMSAGSSHLSLRVGPPVCWSRGWGPPCLLAQPTCL